ETAESPREAAEPTPETAESPREAAEPTPETAEPTREATEWPREATEPVGTPPGTGADAAAEPAAEGPAAPDGATIAQRAESAPDAATQPPSKPKDAVTVHFATNRNRLAPKDRQWLVYFKGFFFTLPAIVIYALVILALLILPWFGKRSWAAYALVTGAVALCAMGSLEAYVRSQLRDELSGELFGSRPTELSYGACEVSVPLPENRQSGELNRPVSVWVFEAPENPEKHFMLRKVTEHADKDAFFSSLSAEIEQAGVPAAMLFIHGYNVSFEDAIFRTAQLAVDLKFPGAAVTFSWPSYADPVKYTFDEQNAEVSIPALGEFLQDLAAKSGAQRIHIIAHSMGNRVLAGAMENMDRESRERNRKIFREVVLAAPDIDRRVFESQVLPHIAENTQHCTLYASSRDRALLISRYFHNYQRLGETEPELIVAQGMDTIDASLVDTSLLGHSYIGDVQSIVSDLHDLMVGGKGPMERLGLESFRRGDMTYWSIKPRLEAATDAPLRR
ncbi:MAG: alpha/beta hydrolase, partial [Pirellulales bacterium]